MEQKKGAEQKKGPVILVILAAGSSLRFGGNKLLHDLGGKPMYRYLADEIAKLPAGVLAGKILVTQYDRIGEDLGACGYEVVKNQEPELGISQSIHLGIRQAQRMNLKAGLCFAVCDQPYLRHESIEALIEGWRCSEKGIACLCHQEELGNPALFSEQYVDELLNLKGDVGGKKVMRRHMDDVLPVEVEDEMELVDIDVQL